METLRNLESPFISWIQIDIYFLASTNYRLISTQWRGSPGSKLFPNGEVPRFLTNVTLETYDQYSHGGTCMGCHATATTAAGQDANFSFFLSKAR